MTPWPAVYSTRERERAEDVRDYLMRAGIAAMVRHPVANCSAGTGRGRSTGAGAVEA